MLYTRKGDSGKTKIFYPKDKKISKSSCLIESLGVLDELNSFLGLVKVRSKKISWKIKGKSLEKVLLWIQNCLFIIQAEIAGSDKKIDISKVEEMEVLIADIEEQLPPIKTFFIGGGTEFTALLDISRTLARKAERVIVGAHEEKNIKVGKDVLSFLNRLSSLLYALARLTNHKSGINEEKPWY